MENLYGRDYDYLYFPLQPTRGTRLQALLQKNIVILLKHWHHVYWNLFNSKKKKNGSWFASVYPSILGLKNQKLDQFKLVIWMANKQTWGT